MSGSRRHEIPDRGVRDLLTVAKKQGIRIERAKRNGHFKVYPPIGPIIVVATTPSRSAIKRIRCELRKGGVKV